MVRVEMHHHDEAGARLFRDYLEEPQTAGRFLMDWLNHETWKPVADLVTDWKAIGTFALAIGGALWR
jgi:hypothetical protein